MSSIVRISLATLLLAFLFTFAFAPAVRADDRAPQCASADAATADDVAGTIVNLSCDSVRPSGGVARCDVGEHYFALKIAGEGGLHPLLVAGSLPSTDQLRAGAFTGKQVRVTGVSAPSGVILVSDIQPIC